MNELNLTNCVKNVSYKIKDICLSNNDIIKLLSNLGIKVNEEIVVLSSNYCKKSFLVNVCGINYALDKKICGGIIVE